MAQTLTLKALGYAGPDPEHSQAEAEETALELGSMFARELGGLEPDHAAAVLQAVLKTLVEGELLVQQGSSRSDRGASAAEIVRLPSHARPPE